MLKWLKSLFSRKDDVERQYPDAPKKRRGDNSVSFPAAPAVKPARETENPRSPAETTDSCIFFKWGGEEEAVPDSNASTADLAPTPRRYGSYSSVKAEDAKDLKAEDAEDMTLEDLDRYVGRALSRRGSALSSYVPAVDCERHAGYRPWWDMLPTERVDRPWRSEVDDEYLRVVLQTGFAGRRKG